MNNVYLLLAVTAMAITTYLIRAIPLVLFRKKLKNKYLYSFLNYIPYAVLTALIVPGILYSTKSAVSIDSIATTQNIITACIGGAVALILSLLNRSLIIVAVASTIAVYIAQFILSSI
ncbi:MAG: AzlD domain-containing protein [Clostridia bacterium]|nr:AzlD domain-containing protein [Clostridia bacterium]